MDRLVSRERTKRRMIATALRSNYKYRDPKNIPVNASPRSEQLHKLEQRAAPFARPRTAR